MSKTTKKFSPVVRESAVWLVVDSQGQHGSRWHAVLSISWKIDCEPQTLNDWFNKAEVDSGRHIGVERKDRELRQANEILRRARMSAVRNRSSKTAPL